MISCCYLVVLSNIKICQMCIYQIDTLGLVFYESEHLGSQSTVLSPYTNLLQHSHLFFTYTYVQPRKHQQLHQIISMDLKQFLENSKSFVTEQIEIFRHLDPINKPEDRAEFAKFVGVLIFISFWIRFLTQGFHFKAKVEVEEHKNKKKD